ncbi:MAG: translation initiation factor IF-2 associated domain-containing protein, partial [Stellaceae bacterium]
MAENSDEKRPLTLGGRPSGKLELRKPIETGSVRQSFPHGRSKTVQVEVRRKRATPGVGMPPERPESAPTIAKEAPKPATPAPPPRRGVVLPHGLTPEEAARRSRALKGALKA